jgi:hypothetical protein
VEVCVCVCVGRMCVYVCVVFCCGKEYVCSTWINKYCFHIEYVFGVGCTVCCVCVCLCVCVLSATLCAVCVSSGVQCCVSWANKVHGVLCCECCVTCCCAVCVVCCAICVCCVLCCDVCKVLWVCAFVPRAIAGSDACSSVNPSAAPSIGNVISPTVPTIKEIKRRIQSKDILKCWKFEKKLFNVVHVIMKW